MGRRSGVQVGPEQYYAVAMQLLAEHGPAELKIATLCARLGVTSGSFYHHFDGWSGFVRGLLAHWEVEQTAKVVEVTESVTDDPVERLDVLRRFAVSLPHAAEAAIRNWAALDPEVGLAQRRVDERRRAALEDVLAGAVRDRADAARLASLGMSILVGFQQIHHPPDPSLLRMHLEDYHVLVLRHVPRPDGGHTIVSRA
ncbi:TetR/AcrR family transcriptional regulator [Pseudonocardia thermophila]|uniref:TetR/AcrR family transcriptional regulator n=1 Tax=Pseudonocardia thermophila TaxID=1848 RepID=UPI00248EF595|nr:TetR/AcrR family transcriptional regulator [Pseudonocardia thermophila]